MKFPAGLWPSAKPQTVRRHVPTLAAIVMGMLIFSPAVFSSESTLMWDRCIDSEVIGYRLYYGNASRDYFPAIEVGNQTSYEVSGLIEGIPYFFAVTAYDRYGNESDYSEEVSQTIYENAEDLSTSGWEFCPQDAGGAEIRLVFDADLQRKVIELRGSGLDNCYSLRRNDYTDWNNSTQFVLAWRMKYAAGFRMNVLVASTAGNLVLRYSPGVAPCTVSEATVRCGLGAQANDGQWRRFTRNLQTDLEVALPGIKILKIKRLQVRGSGRLTDIRLLSTSP